MSDKQQDQDKPSAANTSIDTPADTSRRRFLGGVAVLGAGATLSSVVSAGESTDSGQTTALETTLSGPELDQALQDNVKTIVVIFGENRSFNNLFANFPGVEKPLSAVKPADYQQRDRDGKVLDSLPLCWGGICQVGPQNIDGVTYATGVQYQENLPNAPYALKGPSGEDLPLSVVTRDLWHVFYQNQMQINGGKNDAFVAWADSGGLTMGYYPQTQYSLRLWDVAREFVLCDNFFQGAFGGSFLNHQYLVSAKVPFSPAPPNPPPNSQIAKLQSDDPLEYRLKPLEKSPASAMTGPPQFGPSLLTPDGYAVNTMAPPYWPTWLRDKDNPDYLQPNLANMLVPQTHDHIGDKLSKKNIDWAWYSGAWQVTLDAYKDSAGIPKIPNFQYHHQPLNYFKRLGPENTAERNKRLRDGGLGVDPATNKFCAEGQAGKWPAVTFYKPQGNLNMHAGYADVAAGDRPIDRAVKMLRNSPQWKNMVIVITVDENGGWGGAPR